MNIQPTFLNHWKVKTFSRKLNDPAAPLYLIALWGHCQTSKAWVFDIPVDGVSEICGYLGDANDLNDALESGGWIARNGDSITVVGWDEYNAGLVARWTNGARGGRPKKPVGNLLVNRKETSREPEANLTETNRIGLDRIKQNEKNKSAPSGPARKPDYTPEFESWWKSYPARPGCPKGNKREAFEAWDALGGPEIHAEVLQATKALSASDQLPKDAQRFLRPVRGKGDPEYMRWVDIEPPPSKADQRVGNAGKIKPADDIIEKLKAKAGIE